MSVDQDIKNSSEQLKADVSLTHQIVHGNDTTEVMTEGGPVPSWAKVAKDGEAEIVAQFKPTVGTINEHAALVTSEADRSKNEANRSETEADRSASYVQGVADEGVKQLQAVTAKGAEQTAAVNAAGADRVAEITAAGQTAEAAAGKAQGIADQFGDVDSAVSQARTEADRSTAEANKATSAKNAAVSAQSGAEQAKDDAVAIVHNDEGSLVSKAGAYPVADSNGHLDVNWTPLLAAMYPYSGVIGSVDKEDLFTFYTGGTIAWSNSLYILKSEFNIAGRFVKSSTTPSFLITLPEAESTADRAIAFDDIFLDWNGNVTPYRSITPHRTVTGYDRDAIAAEHGYSKVQTGLYKQGDTYALLLGRVTRRNQGAYHPVYNPEGAKGFINHSGYVRIAWYSRLLNTPTTNQDCFTNPASSHPYTDGYVYPGSGSISTVTDDPSKGRPDGKCYDAIYPDDFTPLYYSAKNVVDRQALLFDSFNRAVAGDTFSGAEGTSKTSHVTDFSGQEWIKANGSLAGNNFTTTAAGGIATGKYFTDFVECTVTVDIVAAEQDTVIELRNTSGSQGSAPLITRGVGKLQGSFKFIPQHFSSDVAGGLYIRIPAANKSVTINSITINQQRQPSARPQFLMVDIIGSLDAMPDEWKTNGIPGNWLAVGENGESLIPDGTSKNFKLSRKCLECYQVLKTTDKGVAWTDATSAFKANFESSSNSHSGGIQSNECWMVSYRTSANPFEFADKRKVLAITDPEQLTYHTASLGSVCVSNLIGKIPTGGGQQGYQMSAGWKNYYVRSDSQALDTGSVHTHLPFLDGDKDTPRAKLFGYLTFASNAMCVSVIYKEVKYPSSGTSGDNGAFDVVDMQSTDHRLER